MEIEKRKAWMRTLALSDQDELLRFASEYSGPEYVFLRAPEIGLVMVQGRVNGDGAAFNLGEMTMVRCVVRTETGQVGYGFVAGRSRKHAELAAYFDALLQDEKTGPELERRLIAPLDNRLLRRRMEQDAATQTTAVDFFTLVRGEDGHE
ncbi:phosphonate C-P lyase system protein PhnG [Desulfonatronum thioautotrophicum]|uniref:phosphonate C-P lyase system protein PhnG n=1 Tax=Desulfonatronum thioautotrophicum TaxID=617001 RepID=UPI0005EB1EFA|nr:phosphonate C-P lyase system protein PhnG [Desulfonatronum thioautotrophicum]